MTATTTLAHRTVMQVACLRRQGKGRIFYSSLEHSPGVLGLEPVTSMSGGRTLGSEGRNPGRSRTLTSVATRFGWNRF